MLVAEASISEEVAVIAVVMEHQLLSSQELIQQALNHQHQFHASCSHLLLPRKLVKLSEDHAGFGRPWFAGDDHDPNDFKSPATFYLMDSNILLSSFILLVSFYPFFYTGSSSFIHVNVNITLCFSFILSIQITVKMLYWIEQNINVKFFQQ